MTDPTEAISRMRKLLSDADAQISRTYQGQVLHDIRALLDRLDSAEAEVLEQARLNGMGSEREAALLARLDSAERALANVASYWITRGINPIKVECCRQIEGPDKWAIRQGGNCLNKSGEWEWEPMPSSRDDDFLARCRFDAAQEAIDAAMRVGAVGGEG